MAILLGRIWEWGWNWLIVDGGLSSEFLDCDGCESARRGGFAGNQRCGCDAHWAHGILLTFLLAEVASPGSPSEAGTQSPAESPPSPANIPQKTLAHWIGDLDRVSRCPSLTSTRIGR
jgi:hypothetical protein